MSNIIVLQIKSLIVVFILFVASCGYYFWINHFNWYLDSFFIKEFEKYSAMELHGETEVIWKWATPRGGDGEPHYVTAAIINPSFDVSFANNNFKHQSNCYKLSGGARRFISEESPLKCWTNAVFTNQNEVFLMLYAANESILLFKRKYPY